MVRSVNENLPTFEIDGELSRGIILETIKRGEDDTEQGILKMSVFASLYDREIGRVTEIVLAAVSNSLWHSG